MRSPQNSHKSGYNTPVGHIELAGVQGTVSECCTFTRARTVVLVHTLCIFFGYFIPFSRYGSLLCCTRSPGRVFRDVLQILRQPGYGTGTRKSLGYCLGCATEVTKVQGAVNTRVNTPGAAWYVPYRQYLPFVSPLYNCLGCLGFRDAEFTLRGFVWYLVRVFEVPYEYHTGKR